MQTFYIADNDKLHVFNRLNSISKVIYFTLHIYLTSHSIKWESLS